jgi:hypothetical protein
MGKIVQASDIKLLSAFASTSSAIALQEWHSHLLLLRIRDILKRRGYDTKYLRLRLEFLMKEILTHAESEIDGG